MRELIESLYQGPPSSVYLPDEQLSDYAVHPGFQAQHTQYVQTLQRQLESVQSSLTTLTEPSPSTDAVISKLGGEQSLGMLLVACVTCITPDTSSSINQHPPAPWASTLPNPATDAPPSVSQSAFDVLCLLARLLPSNPSAARYPELEPATPSDVQRIYGSSDMFTVQTLLCRYSRVYLSCIRTAIESGRPQDFDLDPDLPIQTQVATSDRLLAAQRLCTLMLFLRGPALSLLINETHALILAADCWGDASIKVQLRGALMFHRAAIEGNNADLRPFRDALLPILIRGVEGGAVDAGPGGKSDTTSAAVWSCKLAAAVAAVTTLEGRDPRAEGYSSLMKAVVGLMERRGDDPVRRASILAVLPPLCEVQGLLMCRYLTRMLAVLCEWMYMTHDPQTQALTLDALLSLIRSVWPRIPPHAPYLLEFLLSAYGATSTRTMPLPPSSFASLIASTRGQAVQIDAEQQPWVRALEFAAKLAEEGKGGTCSPVPEGLKTRFVLTAGLLWELSSSVSDGEREDLDDVGVMGTRC